MEEDPIIYGIRDESFVNIIKQILENAGIKQKYIDKMINKNTLKIFDMCFTSKSADPIYNYEFLEMLGDSTLGKFLVWYYSRRFPQLVCSEGVEILARLKISYGSKIMVSRLAKRMGFNMSFVTIRKSKLTEVTKTMEDVGEAFIGAVEKIFDESYPLGIGYNVVYDMLKYYMDTEEISLKYEDLVDAKTRLFHLVDYIQKEFKMDKKPIITFSKSDSNDGFIEGKVYMHTDNTEFNRKFRLGFIKVIGKEHKTSKDIWITTNPIGFGKARTAKEVEQQASDQAIKYFADMGVKREIPEVYIKFCQEFPFDLNFK